MGQNHNGYWLTELEITGPVTALKIPDGSQGIGLLLRRHGYPVGFTIRSADSGAVLSSDSIKEMVEQSVAPDEHDENVPEMASFPSITIAVCTRNRQDVLGRCLERLLSVDRHGLKIEIIVVDNAPEDDRTQTVVAQFNDIRYVREPKPGLSFARNRAVAEANGELIAFTDDDAVVDRCWLGALKLAIAGNPDAVGYSGPVLPMELATEAQILIEARGGFGNGFRRFRYGAVMPNCSVYPCGEAGFGAGANMTIRKSTIVELGGFDDALGAGTPSQSGEDLDIFYRAVRAGYIWFREPRMVVFHQHRRDMESLRRQVRGWAVGNAACMLKYYRTDPTQRKRVLRFLWRLLYRKTLGVAASATGLRRYRWPVEVALAEVQGLLIGLMASYYRSSRAIERVRTEYRFVEGVGA